MKTNVDINSPQEEAIIKSKQNNKNKNEINNSNINMNIKENDEKNKEDKNNNNNDNEKNSQIILDKNNYNNKEKKNKENVEEEKNEEDPLMTYIQSNRKISEEEIKNSSKLILEEIEGSLFNGKIIEINAGGMVEGRNKSDGFAIFGQKKNSNSEINEEKQINDNNDIFIPDY